MALVPYSETKDEEEEDFEEEEQPMFEGQP
jgi:hypothetical protein